MRPACVFLILIFLLCACACAFGWEADFKSQIPANRPSVDARYADARRFAFELNGKDYALAFNLLSDSGQKLTRIASHAKKTADNILLASGAYLTLVDSTGKTYSSANSKKESRINIYRRGPYFVETHWLDIELADENGEAAPVRCEAAFYSYTEKVHISAFFHVTGDISVRNAGMAFDFDAETAASRIDSPDASSESVNNFLIMKRKDNAPTIAFIYPVVNGVNDVVLEKIEQGVRLTNFAYSEEVNGGNAADWKKDEKHAMHFALFPLPGAEVTPELAAEAEPIFSGGISATFGRSAGYDPTTGAYVIQTDNIGSYSYHYYQDQNAYERAKFTIKNNARARKAYIRHETAKGAGGVGCGVALDENGDTLPIMVQTGKNYCGEIEEPFYDPEDKAYSDTIFPLMLDADEERTLTSVHIYQNWGNHPIKGLSSLRSWVDYLLASTGVVETSCAVPFNFGGLDGLAIAELRPMSGRLWKTEPQHDNIAGHSFLRYQTSDNRWHYIEYAGAKYHSVGPNYSDVSLNYISDDGAANASVRLMEFPQLDETRVFAKLRIDFTKDIEIKDGDFAKYMRFFNFSTWAQGMRYTQAAIGSADSDPTLIAIKPNDNYSAVGAELAPHDSYIAMFADRLGSNAVIIRNYKAKIGGEECGICATIFGEKDGDTSLALAPRTGKRGVKQGDYIEANLILLPYWADTQDWRPAKKSAADFAKNAPRVVSVVSGNAVSDFPCVVRADSGGKAEFSVAGGADYIPIMIEGVKNRESLRLYNMDSGRKMLPLSLLGEKDGYQTYMCEDGTFGWVFLIKADGAEHKYCAE